MTPQETAELAFSKMSSAGLINVAAKTGLGLGRAAARAGATIDGHVVGSRRNALLKTLKGLGQNTAEFGGGVYEGAKGTLKGGANVLAGLATGLNAGGHQVGRLNAMRGAFDDLARSADSTLLGNIRRLRNDATLSPSQRSRRLLSRTAGGATGVVGTGAAGVLALGDIYQSGDLYRYNPLSADFWAKESSSTTRCVAPSAKLAAEIAYAKMTAACKG